jgi:hypothetical protein
MDLWAMFGFNVDFSSGNPYKLGLLQISIGKRGAELPQVSFLRMINVSFSWIPTALVLLLHGRRMHL